MSKPAFNDVLMNDDLKEIISLTRAILEKELVPRIKECDAKAEYPMDVHQKMIDAGLYGLNIPTRYGGMGLNHYDYSIFCEEIARFDGGFGFSYMSTSANFDSLMNYASEEQLQYAANRILEDHAVMGFALTEPDAGSDLANLRTSYKKDGDYYVLNGRKCFCSNGAFNDFMIVAATSDRSLGTKGISLFLVERSDGYQSGRDEDKMGLRLSNTCDVIFEDVRVPASRLLGEEGMGFKYCMRSMESIRPFVMGNVVGLAQGALDYAVEYAHQRVQFGKPVIENQGLGFLLADIQGRIHAARCMILTCAQLVDQGVALGTLSSSTKFMVSELCMQATIDAVQVAGGYGYMKDYPLEQRMRDAKIFSIFDGTNQINRMVVAGQLKRGAY